MFPGNVALGDQLGRNRRAYNARHARTIARAAIPLAPMHTAYNPQLPVDLITVLRAREIIEGQPALRTTALAFSKLMDNRFTG